MSLRERMERALYLSDINTPIPETPSLFWQLFLLRTALQEALQVLPEAHQDPPAPKAT